MSWACDKVSSFSEILSFLSEATIFVVSRKSLPLRQSHYWERQTNILFMDTEAKQKEVVKEEKVVHDENDRYASKGVAGSGLGLGIAGTALGLMALWGRGGSLLGGSTPENININTDGGSGSSSTTPSSFEAWEKVCEDALKLTDTIWGLKLNTQQQMYAHRETDINEKFQHYKSQIDADHSLYRSQVEADFGLYKSQRDLYDVLNERYGAKFAELDKKVAVMEAVRPYQDSLIQCGIDKCVQRRHLLHRQEDVPHDTGAARIAEQPDHHGLWELLSRHDGRKCVGQRHGVMPCGQTSW